VNRADRGRGALGTRSNYAGPPAPEDRPGYRPAGPGDRPGEGRIARGSRLSSEAFEVIRHDRGLLSLALAALVMDLLVSGAFLGIAAAVAGGHHRRLVLVGAAVVASYPITVVGTFLNVALLNTVARRWNGEDVTVRDGLVVARRQWRPILAWSVVAASIGAVLSIAERVNHLAWVERLVAFVLDIAWGAAAFFVIPALASDGVGPVEAFKRSVATIRRRWAEAATGTIAIGGVATFLLIPGVLLCVAGYQDFGAHPASGATLLGLGILVAAPVMVYSSATSAVFTLAVYRYAQDEDAHGPFARQDLANPFVGGANRSSSVRQWLARTRRSKGQLNGQAESTS
jgi:hypothetical protein